MHFARQLKFILFALPAILLLSLPAQAEILKPLGLEDAHLLKRDQLEMHMGLSYADGLHNFFQSQSYNRQIAEVPNIALNYGLGERVEAQFIYSYLFLKRDGQTDKWGSGDATLGFKIRLLEEGDNTPAAAFRVATKLPNADEHDDFGTDETDIFLELLGAKAMDSAMLYVNAGIAILGDPRPTSQGQDDLLKYGVGIKLPANEQLAFLISAEGLGLGESVNERGAVRGGIQYAAGRFTWDMGGSIGYTKNSEDWSIRAGVTTRIDYGF